MDNNNQKVTYVATFQNHFGAMLFKKRIGDLCTLKPVPRVLSSSCGTAAFFSIPFEESMVNENLEAVYIKQEDGYRKIYEQE